MNLRVFILFSLLGISLSKSLSDEENLNSQVYAKMLRLGNGDIQKNIAELIKYKLYKRIAEKTQPVEILPQSKPQLQTDKINGKAKYLLNGLDIDSLIRKIYNDYKDTSVAHANPKFNVHIYQFDDDSIPVNHQFNKQNYRQTIQINEQPEQQKYDQAKPTNIPIETGSTVQQQYTQQSQPQNVATSQAQPAYAKQQPIQQSQPQNVATNRVQPAYANQQPMQQSQPQNVATSQAQPAYINQQPIKQYNQQSQPQNVATSQVQPAYANQQPRQQYNQVSPSNTKKKPQATISGRLNKVSKSYHKFYKPSKQQGPSKSPAGIAPAAAGAGAVLPTVGGRISPPVGGLIPPMKQIGGIISRAVPGVPVAGPFMLSHQAFRPHGSPLNSHASNNRGWNGFRGKKDRVRGRAIGIRGLANPAILRGPPTIGHLL